jgi:hypothetical protein
MSGPLPADFGQLDWSKYTRWAGFPVAYNAAQIFRLSFRTVTFGWKPVRGSYSP